MRQNTEFNREEWCDIALPFEETLDEIVAQIFKEKGISGDQMMEGNATIERESRKGNGFIVKLDSGATVFLPRIYYKGKSTDPGTRIRCGKSLEKEAVTICLDSMECVSFDELKYRMFSNIEDGRMVLAATAAWAIYETATDGLQSQMRDCVHKLRYAYKRFVSSTTEKMAA